MDSELQDLAWTTRCFYTRYADDITFSTTLKEFPIQIAKVHSLLDVEISKELDEIITSNGFNINPNKTRAFSKRQRQEVTGLTVNRFPNVRKKYIAQIRAMLHAWDRYGLENATLEYFRLYDNKHRNPNYDLPSFKKIVVGKIEFLGMVKGTKNRQYRRFKNMHLRLSRRDKGVPFTKLPPNIESQLTIYRKAQQMQLF